MLSQQVSARIKVPLKSVKSEPVDADLSQVSPSPSKKKGPEMRFSSPILISSSESDISTPKARPAKKGKGPRSAIKSKHMYVRCSLYSVLPPLILEVRESARAARRSNKAPSTPLHSKSVQSSFLLLYSFSF